MPRSEDSWMAVASTEESLLNWKLILHKALREVARQDAEAAEDPSWQDDGSHAGYSSFEGPPQLPTSPLAFGQARALCPANPEWSSLYAEEVCQESSSGFRTVSSSLTGAGNAQTEVWCQECHGRWKTAAYAKKPTAPKSSSLVSLQASVAQTTRFSRHPIKEKKIEVTCHCGLLASRLSQEVGPNTGKAFLQVSKESVRVLPVGPGGDQSDSREGVAPEGSADHGRGRRGGHEEEERGDERSAEDEGGIVKSTEEELGHAKSLNENIMAQAVWEHQTAVQGMSQSHQTQMQFLQDQMLWMTVVAGEDRVNRRAGSVLSMGKRLRALEMTSPWLRSLQNAKQLNTAWCAQLRDFDKEDYERTVSPGFWVQGDDKKLRFQEGISPMELGKDTIYAAVLKNPPEEDYMDTASATLKRGVRKRLLRNMAKDQRALPSPMCILSQEWLKKPTTLLARTWPLTSRPAMTSPRERTEGGASKSWREIYRRMSMQRAMILLGEGESNTSILPWSFSSGKLEEGRSLHLSIRLVLELGRNPQCSVARTFLESRSPQVTCAGLRWDPKKISSWTRSPPGLSLTAQNFLQRQVFQRSSPSTSSGRAKNAEKYPPKLCQAIVWDTCEESTQSYVILLGDEEEDEKLDEEVEDGGEEAEEISRWPAQGREEEIEENVGGEGVPEGREERIVEQLPCALSPKEQAMVKKLHVNLGHPSKKDFYRALRMSRAREEVLQYFKDEFKCELCEEHQNPKPSRPASIPQVNQIELSELMLFSFQVCEKRIKFLFSTSWGHFREWAPIKYGLRLWEVGSEPLACQNSCWWTKAEKGDESGALVRLIGARALAEWKDKKAWRNSKGSFLQSQRSDEPHHSWRMATVCPQCWSRQEQTLQQIRVLSSSMASGSESSIARNISWYVEELLRRLGRSWRWGTARARGRPMKFEIGDVVYVYIASHCRGEESELWEQSLCGVGQRPSSETLGLLWEVNYGNVPWNKFVQLLRRKRRLQWCSSQRRVSGAEGRLEKEAQQASV